MTAKEPAMKPIPQPAAWVRDANLAEAVGRALSPMAA